MQNDAYVGSDWDIRTLFVYIILTFQTIFHPWEMWFSIYHRQRIVHIAFINQYVSLQCHNVSTTTTVCFNLTWHRHCFLVQKIQVMQMSTIFCRIFVIYSVIQCWNIQRLKLGDGLSFDIKPARLKRSNRGEGWQKCTVTLNEVIIYFVKMYTEKQAQ